MLFIPSTHSQLSINVQYWARSIAWTCRMKIGMHNAEFINGSTLEKSKRICTQNDQMKEPRIINP